MDTYILSLDTVHSHPLLQWSLASMSKVTPSKCAIPSTLINSVYLLHTHKEEEGWKHIKRRKYATKNICKDISNKSYRKATKNKTKKWKTCGTSLRHHLKVQPN